MLTNYLKIAWRNIVNNSVFTAINIFGLTVGIAACLVIFLIVNFELNFDKFHKDGDRIYRVYTEFRGIFNGFNSGVSDAVPAFVQENFSGIESSTHFHTYEATVTVKQNNSEPIRFEREGNMAIVGTEYFMVFDAYRWLVGNVESLKAPHQVVLTLSKAQKYFGDKPMDEIIGNEIIYNDSLSLSVGGIVEDLKGNTDFTFTDFISFATVEHSWLKNDYNFNEWASTNSHSQFFIKLEKGTLLSSVEAQLHTMHNEAVGHNSNNNDYVGWFLAQPLRELHFNKNLGIFDQSRSVAHMPTLRSLIFIALLLLLIASVNFVNLSTAQATRRAKEIGLRKVMGGSRKMLVFQFLSESTLLSLIAVILALPIAELALIYFHEFIPKGVTLTYGDFSTISFLLCMVVVVGLISGLYPAFVISAYQPVRALKDKVYSGSSSALSVALRKGLTIFQFTFSQTLIACAIVVTLQIGYMLKKELGFEKEAIVYFNTPWFEQASKKDVLVNELNQLAEIKAVSVHQSPPATKGYMTNTLTYKTEEGETKENVHRKVGDADYIPFYGLQFMAGRNYIPSDSARELVVNETYAKKLGFFPVDKVLGEQVSSGGSTNYTIVGVIKDFHFQSLHHQIQPLALYYGTTGNCIALKFDSGEKQSVDIQHALDKLQAAWKNVYPDQPLKYYFMDEAVRIFYESEQKTAKLVTTATAITILISCLGLLGLASFTTVQRTKEIGVRKVLGATVSNIVILISKDFIKLVLIAFCMAAPMGYWLAQQWISDFAYRVEINIWIFVLTGLASVLIAFLTLSYQAMKAALTDPVNSLRYE
jgi:putative ABC transport system permease protein